MNILKSLFFLLVFTCLQGNVFAQQDAVLDSLIQEVDKVSGKKKAFVLTQICQMYWYKEPLKAIEYGKRAVKIAAESKDRKQFASSKNSLGYAYSLYGDYASALELMLESLHIFEELNLEGSASRTANNIGTVYTSQKNYEMAAQYFQRFLNHSKEKGDQLAFAQASTNLGVVNMRLEKYDLALQQHQVYEDYGVASKDDFVVAIARGNKGDIYKAKGDMEKAEMLYTQSLVLSKKIEDSEGIALMQISLGEIYLKEGKLDEAFQAAQEALGIAQANNFLGYQQNALKLLSDVSRERGNGVDALKFHDKYMILKDSIFSEESAEKIARLQNSYESAKKELVLREQELEIELLNQNKKIQQITILAVAGILFLILFLGGGLWKTLKKTTIQNQELARQKADLEQYKEEILAQREAIQAQNKELEAVNKNINYQHKRITDSIQYAKRIQAAILPSENSVSQIETIKDQFVLFRPKDVVSGDFYWLSELEDKVILAVGDCTGHGVPGAFMSMIGNDLLNEIIYHRKIYSPEKILAALDTAVRFTLHKENDNTKDGMDIAICVLDKQSKTVAFAGAKMPLLISKINSENEWELIKAKAGSIGGIMQVKGDTTEVSYIAIDQPTKFYLFSDGVQDQFGGKRNKKFMRKNLCNLLHNGRNQPMSQQKIELEQTLDNWMGNGKQTDDMMVWGFQVG